MMSDEEREELDRRMRAESSRRNESVEGGDGKENVVEEAQSVAATEGRHKLTPEQKQKLEAFEKEKAEKEQKRIEDLTQKLKERIRQFVEVRAC